VSGLATAALCARHGWRVTLFERASAVGGRAATRVEHGFSMNLGAHALYLGGPAARLLRELGVAWSGRSPSLRSAIALYRGDECLLPAGLTSLVATSMMSPSAKLEAARWMGRLSRLDPAPFAGLTLEAWLSSSVTHESVRDLLRALVRLSSFHDDAERIGAGAALAQLRVASAGVAYLDGGWQTLVDGLARAAVEAGARLVPGVQVAAVEHDVTARGVRLQEGTRVPARAVIVATPPGSARELVRAGARDGASPDAWPLLDDVRVACLDVGLARLPRSERTFALGVDVPLYFSVHSTWGRLAPPGSALVQTMKYLAPGEHDGAAVESELEALVERMQPGWRRELVVRRYLPQMTVTHAAALAALGGLEGRPTAAWPRIDGLYVAGDWVGPRGMLLDACMASARAAADAAAPDLRQAANA
jgi:phytoene dehydrogenase-like protein